jgi:peptidyl-dipeptidase Dcp
MLLPMVNQDNPFALPSALPFQLPPFDRIRVTDYRPAYLAGFEQHRREIEAIAANREPATFDNTVTALERSGRLLERVDGSFSNLSGSDSNEAMLQIETEMAPLLAAHADTLHLNRALFARIEALHNCAAELDLDDESQQLLRRYHIEFVRAGAQLSDADQDRLRDLNSELSRLTTRFRQNVLRASREQAVVVDDMAELDGLSPAQLACAAADAQHRGLAGKWLLTLQNTTSQPLLAQLHSRALRERLYRASTVRCRGGDTDNTALIARMVRLRAERASLLGYPDHASYVLEDETADSPQAVMSMLQNIATAAFAFASAQAAELQSLLGPDTELQPWDWDYYADRLRAAHYAFDTEQVRPYFELDRVLRDGVFHAAAQLHGLSFVERHDLPVYHADVRVFEVFEPDGKPIALFLADFYARDGKQGGAWMSNFVAQTRLLGTRPVVVNNLNVPKPPAGTPTLLTFDEVTTMFHEFGHALHGMLSDVHFPLLSGTRVPRDFVEFPSQYMEMWARDPAVLAHFARHYRTGEPMPQTLLDKVLAASNFDQGFRTLEYVQAALIDLAWHQITPDQAPAADGVLAFEAAALQRHAVAYAPIPPRYHSPYFVHIFAGGYSAGYYAYLWAEVLARAMGEWVLRRGGLTRRNGDCLRDQILARGHTRDPARMFRDLYGGPPAIEPLLHYRGLTRVTTERHAVPG